MQIKINRILLSILLITTCISSCNQKDQKASKSSELDSAINKVNPTAKPAYSDTVRINYTQNKIILDVLPLIPDSVFKTWEWSKAERNGMLAMLKAKNYFIDTTRDYNTIKTITPDFFETVVVDGNFSLAGYIVSNDDYIFISKNQVGDGSTLAAYEYAGGRLSELRLDYLLGVYFNYFLINTQDETCRQSLQEVWPILDYNFGKKNEIIIRALLDKMQVGTCLTGNVLRLKFNPAFGRFDLEKIEWLDTDNKSPKESAEP